MFSCLTDCILGSEVGWFEARWVGCFLQLLVDIDSDVGAARLTLRFHGVLARLNVCDGLRSVNQRYSYTWGYVARGYGKDCGVA